MRAYELVVSQLRSLYMMDDIQIEKMGGVQEKAEKSALIALSGFENKYLEGRINPLNGVMYTNYLYWLSRFCFKEGFEDVASMVYGLNKMLHAVDLFYAIKLPEIWSCEHPLGAVMGRAEYGNGFFFYQGCTVGGNRHNGIVSYPTIGNNVKMYSNSKILGDSHIGNNVIVAANAYVINDTIPDNCIVFGQSPNLTIKRQSISKPYNYF